MTDFNETRKSIDAMFTQRGQELYDTYTEEERTILQFGMQPAIKTGEAIDKLTAELVQISDDPNIGGGYTVNDITRLLSLAVMDAANRGNQKLVV